MNQNWETDDAPLPMPDAPTIEITAVHYQRLVSLGNYENERVGAWAQVKVGQSPDEALLELRGWVQAQVNRYDEKENLERIVSGLRIEQGRLTRDVEVARARYDKAKAFLEGLGLTLPSRFGADDDMPF